MDERELWEVGRATLGSVAPLRMEALAPFFAETGLDASTFVLLLLVLAQEPETAAIGDLRKVSPYTSLERFGVLLDGAVQAGVLEGPAPGVYRLSKKGSARMAEAAASTDDLIAERCSLAAGDAASMLVLLRRVLHAALDADSPRDPWYTRQLDVLMGRDPRAGPVALVVGCLESINAYRSDSHAAVWAATGVSPVAAEATSVLWRQSPMSFPALVERLQGVGYRRGHRPEAYQQALKELRGAGLVEGTDDALALSNKGQELRETVETDTDARFYGPWGCLGDQERAELGRHLTRLRDSFAPKQP